MNEAEIQREFARRQGIQDLGVTPGQNRIWSDQAGLIGQETDLLQLPAAGDEWASIQDPDTGAMLFMLDLDPLDGGNPLG